MTQIKPLEGMMTPRFADIATFFRLPVVKDLSKLGDYMWSLKPKKTFFFRRKQKELFNWQFIYELI